jgi:MoxR-like ATPase
MYDDNIRASLVAMRQNPSQRLRVDVRRYRAAQLRELLADTQRIDAETFDREVWPIERSASVEGRPLKVFELSSGAPLTPEIIALVERGIRENTLRFQGNSIWGSGSGRYAPRISDPAERTQHVRKACTILTRHDLQPIEKAAAIMPIPGFGPNIATGLVMVFHPDAFALCNGPSRESLYALGLPMGNESDLVTFERSAAELQAQVEAEDFIELDWFLYLVNIRAVDVRLVWWANQGDSFEADYAAHHLQTQLADTQGHRPFHWANIQRLRPTDLVLNYANSTVRAVSRITTMSQETTAAESAGTQIPSASVRAVYAPLDAPLTIDQIPAALRQSVPHGAFNKHGGVNTGFLFVLTRAFLDAGPPQLGKAIEQALRLPDEPPLVMIPPFGVPPAAPQVNDLAEALYLPIDTVREIITLLGEKRQLIFEGPPGAGKTYAADLVARYFAGQPLRGEVSDQVHLIQFHQAFSYEDFIQGIRPVTNGQGQIAYEVRDGLFKRLCLLAERNPDQQYVLIIDEINRGNLAQIFGEVLLLLEYRDDGAGNEKRAILPYSCERFSIPANVLLIGTMNTTDRSLTPIDYALRRRFYFYRLQPVIDSDAPILRTWLEEASGLDVTRQLKILRLFVALNRGIVTQLGDDYQIGHSYFMAADLATDDGLRRLWDRAITPLLREYFYNLRQREETLRQFAFDTLWHAVDEA